MSRTRSTRPKLFAAAALGALALTGACTACTLPPSPPGPGGGTVGPRPLPPTFVPLEVGSFPRPAAEACVDSTTVVDVGAGQSIAAAVTSSPPGTTIRIAPGTYTESPSDSAALRWDTPNLCIVANGGPVVVQAAANQDYGITTDASDTVIEGLTLRGFAYNVALDGGDRGVQRRVTIENVTIDQPAGAFPEGIVAYGDNRSVAGQPPTVDGLLLLDVTMNDVGFGISCNGGPCAHWWIERTTVNARGGGEDSGNDAFAIEEGRQVAVVDSTFRGASADGIDTKADDVVVFGSKVLDVGRNGVKLWRGGDVIDTIVDGTGADASLVGDRAGRYRYLHTLVAHHGRPGDTQYVGTWGYDAPSGSFRVELVNSVLWSNATGGLYVPAGTQLSFRHTIFGDPGSKLVELSDGTTLTTDAAGLAALEANGWGTANVIGDPRFTNTLGGAYTTTAASPARDAGETVAGLARDAAGGPRVKGPAPDIGPMETA